MNVSDVVKTHELIHEHTDYLNQFLEMGWGIVATKIRRTPEGEDGFIDLESYILGATTNLDFPQKYKEFLHNLDHLYDTPKG